MSAPLHAVVLAAGEGTRLGGRRPKVLVALCGRPSVAWPLRAVLALDPERVVVVGGRHLEAIRSALSSLTGPLEGQDAEAVAGRLSYATQDEPRGTGHAVLAAAAALEGADGHLLITYGDCPLLTAEQLSELVAAHRGNQAAVTLLTAVLDEPTGYGRILRDETGAVTGIVEEADADEATRGLLEVNTGVWVVDLPFALEALKGVGSDNAQGEVYLTDLVEQARAAGRSVAALLAEDETETLGFNDHTELALVRRLLRERILLGHLENGVEIDDPDSTFIDADVEIAPGARILPCTMIEGRVRIAAGCEVGPFSHLREGTVLLEGAEVGNFVETKQTTLGPGSKAKHLTYLGNATIGRRSNIGAGTITANYDGTHKHATRIGDGAFVGSGAVIVAPATIGDRARLGAGAIVTRNSDVKDGETWVGVPARRLGSSTRAPSDSGTS